MNTLRTSGHRHLVTTVLCLLASGVALADWTPDDGVDIARNSSLLATVLETELAAHDVGTVEAIWLIAGIAGDLDSVGSFGNASAASVVPSSSLSASIGLVQVLCSRASERPSPSKSQ